MVRLVPNFLHRGLRLGHVLTFRPAILTLAARVQLDRVAQFIAKTLDQLLAV